MDLEQERRRLAALYRSMSDGELQEVASDAASLTDVARQVLAFEVERRHSAIEINDTLADEIHAEFRELVTIAQFRDLPTALLAKGSLESAGIEAFLSDDNMVRMDWFISNLLGGIRLKVRPEDAEQAHQILNGPVPQTFDVEGLGEFEQPSCPKCGSVEIRHLAGRDERALAGLWIASVPLPVKRDIWKCDACGHQWRGDTE